MGEVIWETQATAADALRARPVLLHASVPWE